MFSMKTLGKLLASGVVCAVLALPAMARAQAPADDTAEQSQTSGEQWAKDMDDKLDKAIAILQVLKEEIKTEREDEAAAPTAQAPAAGSYTTPTMEEQMESAQTLAARALRIWRKIMAALGREKEAELQEQAVRQGAGEMAKNLGSTLDVSIRAMEAARKELKGFEEDINKEQDAAQGAQ